MWKKTIPAGEKITKEHQKNINQNVNRDCVNVDFSLCFCFHMYVCVCVCVFKVNVMLQDVYNERRALCLPALVQVGEGVTKSNDKNSSG